jgi:hypothetical protein
MGGNSLSIHDGHAPLNLHSFWDQMLGDSDTYEGIRMLSDAITCAQCEPKKMPEYKRNRTIRSWADESFAAAVAFAYDEGHLQFVEARDSQSGKIPAADVPRLKPAYIINADNVSRRRISLAGKRLADLLKSVF